MKYVFVDESWEDYLYWQKADKKMLSKINDLLKDISLNRFSGIGKPEPLKYKYKGFWSPRIDGEHRLIYKAKDDEILIAKCRFHYDQNLLFNIEILMSYLRDYQSFGLYLNTRQQFFNIENLPM